MRNRTAVEILDFWGFGVEALPYSTKITFDTPFYGVTVTYSVDYNINTWEFVESLTDYIEHFDAQKAAASYWNESGDKSDMELWQLVTDFEAFEEYLISAIRNLRERLEEDEVTSTH